MTKSEKIYHIFHKRRTTLIIKTIKADRYFLEGDIYQPIYQPIYQLCCNILVGFVGALIYCLVGALETSAPPTTT